VCVCVCVCERVSVSVCVWVSVLETSDVFNVLFTVYHYKSVQWNRRDEIFIQFIKN
jgi:hypothetical protein